MKVEKKGSIKTAIRSLLQMLEHFNVRSTDDLEERMGQEAFVPEALYTDRVQFPWNQGGKLEVQYVRGLHSVLILCGLDQNKDHAYIEIKTEKPMPDFRNNGRGYASKIINTTRFSEIITELRKLTQ